MGLGLFKNGRYQPITPYKGSWAENMAKGRDASLESDCQQICGGGSCGTGSVCHEGIDPKKELPAVNPTLKH